MALSKKVLKGYWEQKAEKSGNLPTSTIRDHEARELSLHILKQYLKKSDNLLDVGCGNGFSTFEYAKIVKKALGVDYIPEFIEVAKRKYGKKVKNLEFEAKDVLDWDLPDNTYTKAISERCLINLVSWKDQQKAIKNIWKALKPKGLYLMQELSLQGYNQLDVMRKKFGLEPIKRHWHNIYFDENKLKKFVKPYFKVKEVRRFETYCFLSKVVHCLYVAPKDPKYRAKFNKIARDVSKEMLELNGSFPSHHMLYVLEKR